MDQLDAMDQSGSLNCLVKARVSLHARETLLQVYTSHQPGHEILARKSNSKHFQAAQDKVENIHRVSSS